MEDKSILSIKEIHEIYLHSVVYRSMVPTVWELSLPMPTLRFSKPAYAWFVSAALKTPGSPLKLSPPNIFFALDAITGEILHYDTWKLPLKASQERWYAVDLPLSKFSREASKERFSRVIDSLNQAASDFFKNNAIKPVDAHRINEYLNVEMLAWYKSIAFDFWSVLDLSIMKDLDPKL